MMTATYDAHRHDGTEGADFEVWACIQLQTMRADRHVVAATTQACVDVRKRHKGDAQQSPPQ